MLEPITPTDATRSLSARDATRKADPRISQLRRRLARFRRVVVWGHRLHSHTHSYVHEGFERAFRYLGAETIWTDDPRALRNLQLAGTLFLTEGQAFERLPQRADCHYVLHNVDGEKYGQIAGRVLALQVHDVTVRSRHAAQAPIEKLNEYTFLERAVDRAVTLYQPWATDLLPSEFDFNVDFPAPCTRSKAAAWLRVRRFARPVAVWVGTIGMGEFGNAAEIAPFRSECVRSGLRFVHRAGVTRLQHVALIRRSLLAPAIVGRWQLEHAYIPCRIFKNISYGRLGVTNSPWVQGIFESDILYREQTDDLFRAAATLARDRPMLITQMKEVQERHTFINRIAQIVECLP